MVLPEMKERKDGAIIIVSSIGGLRGSAVLGAYSISKAADMQLARNLAVEHGSDNIRVNAIAPGLIQTDFARALWENPENPEKSNFHSAFETHWPARRNCRCRRIPSLKSWKLYDRSDFDHRWRSDNRLIPSKRRTGSALSGPDFNGQPIGQRSNSPRQ